MHADRRFVQVFASSHLRRRVTPIFDSIRQIIARAGFAWLPLLALALSLASSSFVSAADPAEEGVTLNFVNADIDAVVRAISEITGRNFVVDPKVKGTINIVSARPVPRNLVYPTLLSALRLQGFAAVESDGVVKIVPEVDAKQQGGAVTRGPTNAVGDQLVTQVTTLRYESAAQLVNVLRPLITPNNAIAAYPGTNALIITDYASNLRRINNLIASLDQPPQGEPVIVPVKYASALDIVPMLQKLLVDASAGAATDGQQRVTLVADPRSNNILVRADNPGRAKQIRQLIEQLDTPGRPGGNIFIIYLKNAEAWRVAQTLRALLSGGSDPGSGNLGGTLSSLSSGAGTNTGMGTAGTATTPASSNPTPASGSSGGGGSFGSSGGGTYGGGGTGSTSFAAGGALIQADTANNALIIMAPEPIYNNLRAIIDRLDIRRAQVFVEALIVEVSADKSAEFGIQWQALGGINSGGVQGIGGTNFTARDSGNNIISSAVNLGTIGQGLSLGIINGMVTIPGLGQILNLAFLARALETQANANILSTPTLLTLDNEEAKIVVGQNVPFITGQYTTAGTGAAVSPFQTVERKDVGLTLRVKPQITEGGSVRLAIYQEVSRVDSQSNPAGIITNKRSIESSVIVDDGQIVVLGGLMQDTLSDNTQKVPLAGDLPLLGGLFRFDNRQRVKTNLMVFLKPTVVRRVQDTSVFTQDRYDFLKGEQERFKPADRLFWNDPTYPQLAPVDQAGPLFPGSQGTGIAPGSSLSHGAGGAPAAGASPGTGGTQNPGVSPGAGMAPASPTPVPTPAPTPAPAQSAPKPQ
jgi:general secretion pathway protein D